MSNPGKTCDFNVNWKSKLWDMVFIVLQKWLTKTKMNGWNTTILFISSSWTGWNRKLSWSHGPRAVVYYATNNTTLSLTVGIICHQLTDILRTHLKSHLLPPTGLAWLLQAQLMGSVAHYFLIFHCFVDRDYFKYFRDHEVGLNVAGWTSSWSSRLLLGKRLQYWNSRSKPTSSSHFWLLLTTFVYLSQ